MNIRCFSMNVFLPINILICKIFIFKYTKCIIIFLESSFNSLLRLVKHKYEHVVRITPIYR